MDELVKGTTEKLYGEEPKAKVFAHPLPFNLIPHIDSFQVGIFGIECRTIYVNTHYAIYGTYVIYFYLLQQ